MLKNLVQLEHVIEGKIFRLLCENDASTHFVKEALFQFQKYIGQIEDAAKAQLEAQNPPIAESPPVEQPKE